MKKDKDKVARGSTLFHFRDDRYDYLKIPKRKKKSKYLKKYTIEELLPKKADDVENIDKIFKLMENKGFKTIGYKRNYLIRRIRARIIRIHVSSFIEYYNLLKHSKDEYDKLIDSISINVTRFFRNRETFDELSKIIKKYVAENIKIWSAGTAVGAEAYSLAFISEGKNVKIVGSDINDDLLSLARNALYDTAYAAELSKEEINRYFDRIDKITLSVKNKYRKMVTFQNIDLIKDEYPNGFDFIVCRNVLIYLDPIYQETIFQKLSNSLKVGGYLILGRTESILKYEKYGLSIYNSKHKIYQKTK